MRGDKQVFVNLCAESQRRFYFTDLLFLYRVAVCVVFFGYICYYFWHSKILNDADNNQYSISSLLYSNEPLQERVVDEQKFAPIEDHYFSIELMEPGVTELSCFTTNFLHRWHQLHPQTLFHLYVVGHDLLKVPEAFPNLRLHELNSSLIKQTPLEWWLNAHVYWKYQTAMKTIIQFDLLNVSYNPSDHPIPMFKHLTVVYSTVLLWHYGGTFVSTNIALIKPITTLTSTNGVTLIQRSNIRISLDFLSVSIMHHHLIEKFLIRLSDAYRYQDVMRINAELILSETVEFSLLPRNSLQLLPDSTFYEFSKETMFSNWFTTKDTQGAWDRWQADTNRYGIHFPIVRVPRDTPIPTKDSLIDRLTSLPPSLTSTKQVSCFHASTDRIHMGQLLYQNIHNYGNNGDYMQAWAAIQYYPCIDRFFERDNMHNLPHMTRMKFGQSSFLNDSMTPASIIMNAWWAHVHTQEALSKFWPPPDYLRPVYIAMHLQYAVESAMTKKSTTFDRYGPVGARDMRTLQLFRKSNISSWFSGCLTTTLKLRPIDRADNKTKKFILVVDIEDDLLNTLVPPDVLRKDVKRQSVIYHPKTMNQIYEQVDEFNHVRKRLHDFLNSRLVITSRLHVLLPCLALNVPVMFIYPSEAFKKDRRFEGLIDALVDHVYSENDQFFWQNRSHPHFIDWQNPRLTDKPNREALKRIISGLHQRLKQEREFRIWGQFYQVYN